MYSDLEKVGAGLGDKLAFIFQAAGSFIGGIVVGFLYVWQLGLLIVGCAPIVIVVGGIGQKVSEIIPSSYITLKLYFVLASWLQSLQPMNKLSMLGQVQLLRR